MLETRGWISLILGLVSVALGLVPLLHMFGLIGFNLPFTIAGIILAVLLIVGGIFLLFDSVHQMHLQGISIILGIIFIIMGGLPLLFNFGVISFDISGFLATELVKDILLMVSGVFLIFGAGD